MTSRILKFISTLLVAILVYETAAIPLTQASMLTPPTVMPTAISRLNTNSKLLFPINVADIAQRSIPSSAQRSVYLIQDIHGYVPAQINISDAIAVLSKKAEDAGKRLIVAVEGSSGNIETDQITAIPNQNAKETVGASLLHSGVLFGEEYAAITSKPGQIRLYGIESPSLYRKNYLAKELTEDARKQALQTTETIRKQLETLAPHNFNSVLTTLINKHRQAEEGTLSTTDYAAFLKSVDSNSVKRFPGLSTLADIAEQEKTFSQSEISKESQRLLANIFQNQSDQTVQTIASHAELVKAGNYPPLSFYSELIAQSNIKSALLENYVKYLSTIQSLDIDTVFNELDQAENRIARTLIKHSLAEELFSSLRWAYRQERFFSLSMIPQEWSRQRSHSLADFKNEYTRITSFINEQKMDLGYSFEVPSYASSLKKAFKGAFEFYRTAEHRDQALANNALNLLSQTKANDMEMAIIAGGFHTEGLIAHLNKHHIGVIVVRPQLEAGRTLEAPYNFSGMNKAYRDAYKTSFLNQTMREPGGLPTVGQQNIAAVIANPNQIPPAPKPGESGPKTVQTPALLFMLAAAAPKDLLETPSAIGPLAYIVVVLAILGYGLFNVFRMMGHAQNEEETKTPEDRVLTENSALTPTQVSIQRSATVLKDLIQTRQFDQRRFSKFTDRASALDKQVVYSSEQILPSKKDNVITLPALAIKKGIWTSLVLLISLGIMSHWIRTDETASKRWQSWANDKTQAAQLGLSMADFHASQLNKEYLTRLSAKFNDPKFRQELLENEDALDTLYHTGLDKAFDKHFKKKAPSFKGLFFAPLLGSKLDEIRKEMPNYVPALIESLFSRAKSTQDPEERIILGEKLRIIIEFLSAAPKELDSPSVPKFDPPEQKDIITAEEINAQKSQIDRDVYLGRYAHREFSGGSARRLDVDKPAALLTPADTKMDNLPEFKDIPSLGRFVLQIRASITDIAERNGWDVEAGLVNQRILIPTNSDLAPAITQHLYEMDFYGFPPHAFIFLEQRSSPGFTYAEGQFSDKWKAQAAAEKGPFGHGDLELTHRQSHMAYSLDRDGNKIVFAAPLHRLMAAEDRIILHNQLSLEDVFLPGWMHDHARLAIINKAIQSGQIGAVEFRRDNTGTKGGYLGNSSLYPETLQAYLGKTSGPAMFEQNQLGRQEGDAIRKRLQAETANSGVVGVTARGLESDLLNPNYPFTATVRGNPNQIPSIHPDLVSYLMYFNGEEKTSPLFYVPQRADGSYAWRRELKEKKHFSLFVEDTRIQDSSEDNRTYQRLARPYQEKLSASAYMPHFTQPGPQIRNSFSILLLGFIDWSMIGREGTHLSWGNIAVYVITAVVFLVAVLDMIDRHRARPVNPSSSFNPGESFKTRQVASLATAPEQAQQALGSELETALRSQSTRQPGDPKTIIVPINQVLTLEDGQTQAVAAVDVISNLNRQLSAHGLISGDEIRANIVFSYSGEKDPVFENKIFMASDRLTGVRIMIAHVTDTNNVSQTLDAAGVRDINSSPIVLSQSDLDVDGAQAIQVGSDIAELALTAFAYAHYNDPSAIIQRLLSAFKIEGGLLDIRVMADRLAQIAA